MLENLVSGAEVLASGRQVGIASKPRGSGARRSPVEQTIRPYYVTVTPSQLFRRALDAVPAARSFKRPKVPRVAADDGLAIWFARPGDVLPEGTIAMPVSTPLSDAQPFEYFQSSPNDINQEAASFRLSPAEKTECMQRWEDDHNLCWAIGKPMGGYGTVQACMDRARYNYNICMGFTQQYEHSTLTPATKINRCRLRS
ncbi:hypothetical protein [Paraburkholderia youngii]|uniref:Uncharacterized protein n=1 Tax=Paraburkholderia youngii TaxID=2782701 RepID=A0A7W8L7E4_9BURK|nr:hypothetical protein [Paraburkholderia youngii]MBB5401796.1 hypothetical protein [Paraburkholderia youngii]